MSEFVSRKEVLKILKIHYQTLYKMAERKEIETVKVGKRLLYNIEKYKKEQNVGNNQKKIIYCRVSSKKQSEDLKRQVESLQALYPNHEIISDIGSGLNFNRKGLLKIIEMSIQGKISELVISYKDRLARFGYELIEMLISKYSNGKIIIVNKNEEETPTEELTKDIISIMNIFVAKINGLRKYKKRIVSTIKKN